MSVFKPVLVRELELSKPLPGIPARAGGSDRDYGRALILARLHDQPLGIVEVALDDGGIGGAGLGRALWQAVGEKIVSHLQADGLAPVSGLGAAGLPVAGAAARCSREREDLLAGGPFISVVISTRDRPDLLARCLPSLLAQDYPHFELVVVDNAPKTEATAELFKRDYAHLAQVRYVREERPGLARARNRGVREARGEIVAFTDDDAVADRHWLTGVARGFAWGKNVGCVTGLVLPLELETQAQLWFEEFGGFGKGCESRVYDLGANRPRSPLFPYAAGQFGSGNNMAFRVGVVRAIGGFDPALGAGSPTLGGEDLASFVAALKKGYSLVYEPSAIVRHEHRRDYVGLRGQVYSCGLGLTAFLTKCLVDDPASLPGFVAKIPGGLRYAFDSASPKNKRKRANYPAELTGVERSGMLRGPYVYLRARWRDKREEGRQAKQTALARVGNAARHTEIVEEGDVG
ncbi:MAG: glycosyltransferase family 2 protein [Chloroflexota bacterium]